MKKQLMFSDTPFKLKEFCKTLTNNIDPMFTTLCNPFLDIEYDINATDIKFRSLMDITLYYYLCDRTKIDGYVTIKHNLAINLLDIIGDKYTCSTRYSILAHMDKNKQLNTILLANVLIPLYGEKAPCIWDTISVVLLLLLLSPELPRNNKYDNSFLKNKSKSFLFRTSSLRIILTPDNEIKRDILEIAKWLKCNIFIHNRFANKLSNDLWTIVFLNRIKYLGLNTLLMLSTRSSTIPFLYETCNQNKQLIINDILKGE